VTATFSTFHSTRKSAARLLRRFGLGDWDEKFGSEDRQQLANMGKENLHVVPIGLRKFGSAGLVLIDLEPAYLAGLLQEFALEVSHMGLGEVLVLADEHNGGNPKLL